MYYKCMVSGCAEEFTAKTRRSLNQVRFHPFPNEDGTRRKWIKFCGKGDFSPRSGYDRICEIHFHPSDFSNGVRRKLLNRLAVPVFKNIEERRRQLGSSCGRNKLPMAMLMPNNSGLAMASEEWRNDRHLMNDQIIPAMQRNARQTHSPTSEHEQVVQSHVSSFLSDTSFFRYSPPPIGHQLSSTSCSSRLFLEPCSSFPNVVSRVGSNSSFLADHAQAHQFLGGSSVSSLLPDQSSAYINSNYEDADCDDEIDVGVSEEFERDAPMDLSVRQRVRQFPHIC